MCQSNILIISDITVLLSCFSYDYFYVWPVLEVSCYSSWTGDTINFANKMSSAALAHSILTTSEWLMTRVSCPRSLPQSKMTDRTSERAKWWMPFFLKKKIGGPKETIAADFDPFAQLPENRKGPTAAPPQTTSDQPLPPESSNNSSLISDDTYDDSQLESVFSEQSCRRNLKVSRSGRYKENRRVRSSLPIQEKATESVTSGKEGIRR